MYAKPTPHHLTEGNLKIYSVYFPPLINMTILHHLVFSISELPIALVSGCASGLVVLVFFGDLKKYLQVTSGMKWKKIELPEWQ